MKKILLLGDSIREGYDVYVKKAFSGLYDVVYPSENCRFSSYIIRNLADRADALGCDGDTALVHRNAGLWDDLTLFDGLRHTRPEIYEENIDRIDKMLRLLFPKAIFIFATSTPVQENLFEKRRHKRYNRDTVLYNEIAVRTLAPRGVIINDLYTLLKDAPSEYHSDLTHYYTKEGTRLISDRVIGVIADALSAKPTPLDYDTLCGKSKEEILGI